MSQPRSFLGGDAAHLAIALGATRSHDASMAFGIADPARSRTNAKKLPSTADDASSESRAKSFLPARAHGES